MKISVLSLVVMIVTLPLFARTVDMRETRVMLDALRSGGAQSWKDEAGNLSLVAEEISCIHTSPSPEYAIEPGYACALRDHVSGKVGNPTAREAKLLFILTAHYGGLFTQWTEMGTDFQKVTARSIECHKAIGPNEPWLCDVNGE